MSAASSGSGLRAGPREWLGLAVLALPAMLLFMMLTILFLAIPRLTADLEPSNTQLLWIIDIYGFLMAGFLVTMGTLGDRIGHRRLLMVGAAAFIVVSVLAANTSDPGWMILWRAILGVAAATQMPATLGLIFTMFHDPRQRGVAVGIWAGGISVGTGLGPLIGGAPVEVHGDTLAAFPAPARPAALNGFPGLSDRKVGWLHAVAAAALDGRLDAQRLRSLPREQALAEL